MLSTILPPAELREEIREQFSFNGILNERKALTATEEAYALLWAECERLKSPALLCPECGSQLVETDPELCYPVLRGDALVMREIQENYFCNGCNVGVEASEL